MLFWQVYLLVIYKCVQKNLIFVSLFFQTKAFVLRVGRVFRLRTIFLYFRYVSNLVSYVEVVSEKRLYELPEF